MRISDWSSDVCSSVLAATHPVARPGRPATRPVRRAARARGYSSGWPPDIDREVDGSLIAITIRDDADDHAPDGERRREYPDDLVAEDGHQIRALKQSKREGACPDDGAGHPHRL